MLKLSHSSHSFNSRRQLKLYIKNGFFLSQQYTSASSATKGPSEIYRSKLESGGLTVDSHQELVVKRLQRLYEDLGSYSRPIVHSHTSSFFSIFQRNTKKVHNAPKGVYIYGSVGGGKTMLMDLFYESVPVKEKLRVHFNAFMLNVHSRIHELKVSAGNRSNTQFRGEKSKPFDPIPPIAAAITQESWLICFDEFQVTDIGDAMVLKRLFTQLFDNGCVVVATSNRRPDDLYKNGLQRSNFIPFIPILKSRCDVVNLDSGVDYRMRTASSGGFSTYFINSELTTRSNPVDNLFKALISQETDTVRPRTLNIHGRNVQFSKACGRVLDCTFSELCDRALGASDYLVIGKTFHTVFIREVPQLSVMKHRSQLRRFITLIDNLYDNRVRVVVAADVPPQKLFIMEESDEIEQSSRHLMDDLQISKGSENHGSAIFTGEEEMFATDRCLSRIMEMQSASYWDEWGKTIS